MNKKKLNKNLKKIISVTKVNSINKLLNQKKIQKNRIKNISNINLKNEEIDNVKKNEEKRLEVSVDREKQIKNKKETKDEKNNLDFNAHFKYNDLVNALTTLKNNNKNQDSSNRNKTNKKHNNIKQTNYNIISRNVKMNNYVRYLENIKESKNNAILTNIQLEKKENKTSFVPQTESLKNNILLKFRKREK